MLNYIYESPKFNFNNYILLSKPAVEFGDSATRLIGGFLYLGIAMSKKGSTRKTQKEFIEDAIKIHGNKYDYSLVEYKTSRDKVKIICPDHGIFEQRPVYHSCGSHCPKCAIIKRNASKQLNTEEFIFRAGFVHGEKYNYSKSIYTTTMTPLEIICREHGSFLQRPNNHLNGAGCNKCSDIQNGINNRHSTEQFTKKAMKQHGNKYDYSKSIYLTSKTNLTIICKKHGEFEQSPYSHITGSNCPLCFSSFGEKKVKEILNQNCILFIQQKKFKLCRNIRVLSFDFYLPSINTCIEYDGMQHFEPINGWGGVNNFKKIQKRDNIKTNFCKNNNINLLRIAYNENIEQKLKEVLCLYHQE